MLANKHQRQESLAGDEKSCPVMRGYEPFLSYLTFISLGFIRRSLTWQQLIPELGAGVPGVAGGAAASSAPQVCNVG